MLTLRQSRQLKRKRLIKKLFNKMVEKFNCIEHPIKLKFRTYNTESFHRCFFRNSDKTLTRHEIIFGLEGPDFRKDYTYSDNYYTGRAKKLSVLLKNKKIIVRWLLLHELHHAILATKIGPLFHKNFLDSDYERQADEFALAYCTLF